jgi:hypothetical protein
MGEQIKRNLIGRLKERYASGTKQEKVKILSQVELSRGSAVNRLGDYWDHLARIIHETRLQRA